MQKQSFSIIIIMGILTVSLGCTFSSLPINQVTTGEIQYDSQVIELGDAEEVRVNLAMGAGELKVDNRAEDLLEANFTFNVESWAPDMNYTVEDNKGRLSIRQPQTNDINIGGNVKYAWDLRFAPDIPLDMRIDCGAGDHNLDFSNLSVTSLNVKVGAGNVNIDLTDNSGLRDMDFDIGAGNVDIDLDGVWDQKVDVSIQGGVGRISLRLPNDVGVRVNVSKGIGNVDARGLSRQGDSYTNEAYEENGTVLDIN
ncbi:MAG: toast rack family protein, partial [Anaerolineae bacterium]|nr:toast rack family protein [Anaerolineae bacterium]